MKGRTLHRIVNSFASNELSKLKSFIRGMRNGDRLEKICEFLVENEYSEEGVMHLLRVSRRTKSSLLESLGNSVLQFVGMKNSLTLESKVLLVEHLVAELEDFAAFEMLQEIVCEATATENYEVLLKVNRKLKKFEISRNSSLINSSIVSQHLSSLLLLNEWHDAISDLRSLEDIVKRNQKIGEIRQKSLEHFRSNKLGQRELLSFLRIQAQSEFLLKESQSWVQAQEAVVLQIKTHPWVCDAFEFELAREMKILIQLCMFSGKLESYEDYQKEFRLMTFKSKRAIFEQVQERFPFEFSVAIDKGDREIGLCAISDFSALIDSGILEHQENYLLQCFYWQAYFLFADGRIHEARKVIGSSKQISKSKGSPKFFWLVALLEIIISIELAEFDDVGRYVKNIRYSTKQVSISGATEVLKLIRVLKKKAVDEDLSSINQALFSIQDLEVSKYFDFPNWLLSLLEGGSMLDKIAKQKAHLKI